MKIGIDARLIHETGVGRYIQNLIDALIKTDTENEYILFLREKEFLSYKRPNNRWSARNADVQWHTIKEQFVMPRLFVSERLDLLHVPYFNIPILYPGKMIVTIHDLIVLHVNTGRASTLHPILYNVKRLLYILLLAVGLHRAIKIIAVSQTTKSDIVRSFRIPPQKIDVIYEGAKSENSNNNYQKSNQHPVRIHSVSHMKPYILYVGNAYPHKNIGTLIRFMESIQHTNQKEKILPNNTIILKRSESSLNRYRLLFVGPDDYFYTRYKKYVQEKHLDECVFFYGKATYEQLDMLYKNALALVFPSIMEGFGLPGVEAMHHGIPVVASDIPVFHEIYGDAAYYFDPYDVSSLSDAVDLVLGDSKKRSFHVMKGKRLASQYRWDTMGSKTLLLYKNLMR